MLIVNWRRIVIILFLLTPTLSLATPCSSTIHTIHRDLTDHPDATSYRWASMRWLVKNFGTPSIQHSTSGNHYYWRCDASNFLNINADPAHRGMLVAGQYSDENGAGVFSVDVNAQLVVPAGGISTPITSHSYREVMREANKTIPSSMDETKPYAPKSIAAGTMNPAATNMPPPTPKVMPAPKIVNAVVTPVAKPEPLLTGVQNSAQDFKNWFNADVQTQDQLGDVALKKIQDYYEKLRTCTPGNYTYPVFNVELALRGGALPPLFFLSNSTIVGMKHNKCMVTTISNLPRHLQHTRCAFAESALKYFTADEAKITLQRAMRHEGGTEPSIRAIKRDCTSDYKSPRAELTTHFAEALKACLPGKYKLLKPYENQASGSKATEANAADAQKFFIQEYQIAGYHNGKCVVEGKTETYGQTVTTQCSYSPDTLSYVADKELKQLADNSSASSKQNAMINAQAVQECKYLN